MKQDDKNPKRSKVTIGLIIVIFGILWLTKNLGLLHDSFSHYLFSWQALLICIGLIGLSCKKKPNFGGLILIIIGGTFIAKDFIALPVDAFHLIIPVVIIVIGIYVIFKKMNSPKSKSRCVDSECIDLDTIEEVNIFGGRKSYYDSQNFKGGESVSIFGGSEIDLTGAKLANGIHVLESVSIFGGSVIIVPRNWNIKVEVVGIMGGFSDKRYKSRDEELDTSRTLVIKGVAIFGGGEIKSQ